eukprot:CAMPEP_0184978374 /NCGR_PEP_ID=MMETSP1098-20130426/8881_1 /TAXON_ID=89044 /ORGANISM="Spumella elongata, Strain CCAP 955/1" /LENGTH=299 /DNA_ID=CAMNT_0027501497 /DNA_START=198 /DNA_END=1097 /DNA_ORIENTATION=-
MSSSSSDPFPSPPKPGTLLEMLLIRLEKNEVEFGDLTDLEGTGGAAGLILTEASLEATGASDGISGTVITSAESASALTMLSVSATTELSSVESLSAAGAVSASTESTAGSGLSIGSLVLAATDISSKPSISCSLSTSSRKLFGTIDFFRSTASFLSGLSKVPMSGSSFIVGSSGMVETLLLGIILMLYSTFPFFVLRASFQSLNSVRSLTLAFLLKVVTLALCRIFWDASRSIFILRPIFVCIASISGGWNAGDSSSDADMLVINSLGSSTSSTGGEGGSSLAGGGGGGGFAMVSMVS